MNGQICNYHEKVALDGLEKKMSTNLQDLSSEILSDEFKQEFATNHFSKEIENWFLSAANSIFGIIEAASSTEAEISDVNNLRGIESRFSELRSQLQDAIWNKQDLQRIKISSMSPKEIDFISPTVGHHEKICIFDWIHDYSCEIFPKNIDEEMIHLLFDVLGISTYCHCKFDDYQQDELSFNELERLMVRSTSFEGNVFNREKNSERWVRIMDFYREIGGIQISKREK